MSFEIPGATALDDLPCRYGASRLLCRGPRRALDRPYLACLGGSETYGRFVATPFAAVLESSLGLPCVNLGCVNGGVDAYVHDFDLTDIAARAEVCVIQVMGAQNLSNRFYRVHPRRNDRFVTATPLLQAIYREVDFTAINFNRHLLDTLRAMSEQRFAVVRDELQQVWLARMRLLIRTLRAPPVLLWLRYEGEADRSARRQSLGSPLLIDRGMLDRLAAEVKDIVEIAVVPAGEKQDVSFAHLRAPAAASLIGPATHRQIGEDLASRLRPLI